MMSSEREIIINERTYPFTDDETVLDVARRNGIFIPTLCHLRGTTNTGACRVCIVEVEGVKNLTASCALPASPGMVVHTDSPRVTKARRFVISLLMISGNHTCAARGATTDDWSDFQIDSALYDKSTEMCDAYGHCTLQELAYRYQVEDPITKFRLKNFETHYPLEDANPFIIRDFSRCILCGRCVKACTEIQVNNAISFGYRGGSAKIVVSGDTVLADSDCVFCGECVQVCPTGALVEKDSRYTTRFWELERVKSTCAYCSTGCGIDIYVRENSIVKIEGDTSDPVTQGRLCVRGRYGYQFREDDDRITVPLLRDGNVLKPVSRDRALSFISGQLHDIKEKFGAGSIAGIISGSYSNEDAFVMQKFFSSTLGGAAVVPSFRMQQEDYAITEINKTFYSDITEEEIRTHDLFILTGSEIIERNPVMGNLIKSAALSDEKDILTIDPVEGPFTGHASLSLHPHPGTESTLIHGIIKIIIDKKLYAEEVRNKSNFDTLETLIMGLNLKAVAEETGISPDTLDQSTRLLVNAERPLFLYSTDNAGHKGGKAYISAIHDLALLLSGKADVHVLSLELDGNAAGVHDILLSLNTETKAPAAESGPALIDILKLIDEEKIRGLYLLGTDNIPLIQHRELFEKLKKINLIVTHDLFPTAISDIAHCIIPSTALTEKDGTITTSTGRVKRLRSAVKPDGNVTDDWQIFTELAQLSGYPMPNTTSEEIFSEYTRALASYRDIDYNRVSSSEGSPVKRPVYREDQPAFKAIKTGTTGPGQGLSLIIGARLNASFQYTHGLELCARNMAQMNPADSSDLGISEGSDITLNTEFGSLKIGLELTPDIPAGIVYIPEVTPDNRAFLLLPNQVAVIAGGAVYGPVPVKVKL